MKEVTVAGLRRLPGSLATGLVVIALLAGVLAAPVAAQRSRPGSTPAPGTPVIEGPVWRLVESLEEGQPTPIPPGMTVEALFWAGIVSGFAGCGDYSSTYTLKGPDLEIAPTEAPVRDCDADTSRLQEAFLADLGRVTGWTIEGAELALLDADGNVRLRFTAAEVPSDVTVATWRLARLADETGRLVPVAPSTDASVRFLPGGRVVGDTGCGGFLGSWEASGDDLAVHDLTARTSDCTEGSQEAAQAAALLAMLERAEGFDVTPAGLSLRDASGSRLAAWVPEPPADGELWTPVEIRDPDGQVVVDGEPLASSVLVLDGGSAGGRADCKPWAASLRRSGLALSFDAIKAKGRCRPKLARRAFAEALPRIASFTMRGDRLDLHDATGAIVMRLTPQPPLTGVTWQLTGIDRGSTKLAPPVERTLPTALFSSADGLVRGSTGCNDYTADFSTDGDALVVSGALASGRRCKPPVQQQEALFLRLLAQADGFVVLPDGLRLLDGDRTIMSFRPAAD
jgi:heat shock protein HslJ